MPHKIGEQPLSAGLSCCSAPLQERGAKPCPAPGQGKDTEALWAGRPYNTRASPYWLRSAHFWVPITSLSLSYLLCLSPHAWGCRRDHENKRTEKNCRRSLSTRAKRWSVPNILLLLYPPVCSWTSSSDSFLVFTEYQSDSPSRLQFMQPRGSLCLSCEIIQTSEANRCSLQGHFAHIFLYEAAVKKRLVMFLFFLQPCNLAKVM